MRTSCSVAAFAALMIFGVQPAVADYSGTAASSVESDPNAPATDAHQPYNWSRSGVESRAIDRLPDERMGRAEKLWLMAAASLAVAATLLGLTITFWSLRREMRQRRDMYGPQGLESRSTEG